MDDSPLKRRKNHASLAFNYATCGNWRYHRNDYDAL